MLRLRFGYRNQLADLKSRMQVIGETVYNAFYQTLDVVQNNKAELAKKIFESDSEIDKIAREAEDSCLRLVSLQSPFASDLRYVTGYLKIINDFERIADHCADICEIVSMENLKQKCACLDETVSILNETFEIYKKSCLVCLNLDTNLATEIYRSDDKIDSMFSGIVFNVSNSISEQSLSVFYGADLMFIAKYAERMGDHCNNISKRVIYMVEGFIPDEDYFR